MPDDDPGPSSRPRHFWRSLSQAVRRFAGQGTPAVPEEPTGPPPPAPELIDFLRRAGVALCDSGEATSRVTARMNELVAGYHVSEVHFLVLPTGVFVRIGTGANATVDFAPAGAQELRLDQVGRLYALLDEAQSTQLPPTEGTRRLIAIRSTRPRFGPAWVILGHSILTLGLGLTSNPTAPTLAGYALLGAFVGALRMLSNRFKVLSLALPVAASMLVTVAAFGLAPILTGGVPTQLLIPALVTFLPGAALTIGTMELATGDMVSGASRLIYGFNVLFLLAFGIYAGIQIVSPTSDVTGVYPRLGWWAPWIGVLLVGIGFALYASAPARSLGWSLIVLYCVWGAQFIGSHLVGAVFGAFLGGLLITPVAYAVQSRTHGPPAQVTFLPSFWLLVPGAMGLAGVSELFTASAAQGMTEVITALTTVIAIALGMLVGSSLAQSTGRQLSSIGRRFAGKSV